MYTFPRANSLISGFPILRRDNKFYNLKDSFLFAPVLKKQEFMGFSVFSEEGTPFVSLDLAVLFLSFYLKFYKLPFSSVCRAFELFLFLLFFLWLPEIIKNAQVIKRSMTFILLKNFFIYINASCKYIFTGIYARKINGDI